MSAPKKESMRARAYFDAYCFLGTTRSLSRLATIPIDGKPVVKRTLEEWSRLWDWVKRAEQYDKDQLERKRLVRQGKLDTLYDDLATLCEEERIKTLQDIDKLRNSDKGLGSIASVNLLKLLIDTHLHVLGDGDKKVEVTSKDDGQLEIEVTTFWGRGTDPRRKSPEIEEDAAKVEEDPEIDAEFGAEIPDEDEDWEDESDE
jgi:hypothetical protein